MKKGLMLIMFLMVAGRVMAADPLEVGPNIYKLLFENDRVRVMEVTFQPGDKIGFHSHPDHYAYILSGGNLLLRYEDGTTKNLDGKTGDVIWINAETHAAENVGSTVVKGLITELKEPKPETVVAKIGDVIAEPMIEPAIPEETK